MWSKSIGTIFPTAFAHLVSPFDNSHPISNFSLLLYLLLSGQCVISSVLSPHNTNLKRWTSVKALGQTVSQLSDRSVLQLLVTAQLYLENKGKYILKAWGHANPRDAKRRASERERVREWERERERPPALWLLVLWFFSSPGPALCNLGQPGALSVLPAVLTPVLGPSFSWASPLLVFYPLPFWTPFSYSNCLTLWSVISNIWYCKKINSSLKTQMTVDFFNSVFN